MDAERRAVLASKATARLEAVILAAAVQGGGAREEEDRRGILRPGLVNQALGGSTGPNFGLGSIRREGPPLAKALPKAPVGNARAAAGRSPVDRIATPEGVYRLV